MFYSPDQYVSPTHSMGRWGVMFSTCPSVCACVHAKWRHSLTGEPSPTSQITQALYWCLSDINQLIRLPIISVTFLPELSTLVHMCQSYSKSNAGMFWDTGIRWKRRQCQQSWNARTRSVFYALECWATLKYWKCIQFHQRMETATQDS